MASFYHVCFYLKQFQRELAVIKVFTFITISSCDVKIKKTVTLIFVMPNLDWFRFVVNYSRINQCTYAFSYCCYCCSFHEMCAMFFSSVASLFFCWKNRHWSRHILQFVFVLKFSEKKLRFGFIHTESRWKSFSRLFWLKFLNFDWLSYAKFLFVFPIKFMI